MLNWTCSAHFCCVVITGHHQHLCTSAPKPLRKPLIPPGFLTPDAPEGWCHLVPKYLPATPWTATFPVIGCIMMFFLFPIWSSRDLFCDMLCVFTQLHKPAHIVARVARDGCYKECVCDWKVLWHDGLPHYWYFSWKHHLLAALLTISKTTVLAPQWDHDFSSPNSFHPRLDIMNPESNINYIHLYTSTTYNRWRSRSQSHIKSKGWLLDVTYWFYLIHPLVN